LRAVLFAGLIAEYGISSKVTDS